MSKIKVLATSSIGFPYIEGMSTIMLDYFTYFDKEKYDIDILVNGDYDEFVVSKFIEIGAKIQYVPSRKKNTLEYLKQYKNLLRKNRYDVVYVHGNSATITPELYIAKLMGCKVRIAHSHNTNCQYKKIDKLLRPLFYRSYTDAFACGYDAGKWLFRDRDFKVLKNGRSVNKYKFNQEKRKEVRNQLKLDNNELAIVHVGNFTYQKNQEFLINVFKELIKLEPNSMLYLIGTGRRLEEIKALVKELELNNKVVFMGRVNNVHEILNGMDVVVFPSRHEGLPLVSIEWQLSGIPALFSDGVTNECVFTDFIKFKSLNESYAAWAKEILNLNIEGRLEKSKQATSLANKNGYDIQASSVEFQNYLQERVRSYYEK